MGLYLIFSFKKTVYILLNIFFWFYQIFIFICPLFQVYNFNKIKVFKTRG